MSPPEVQHDQQTRQRILMAAESLFTEHGFQASSIREISQKASCNVALISYYFGSKESLLKEIYQRHALEMRESMMPIANKTQVSCDDLVLLMNAIFLRIDQDAGVFRNCAWATVEKGPMLDSMVEHLWKPFFDVFSTIVARASRKELNPLELKARCVLLSGQIHQYANLRWHTIGKLGLSANTQAELLSKYKKLILEEVVHALV